MTKVRSKAIIKTIMGSYVVEEEWPPNLIITNDNRNNELPAWRGIGSRERQWGGSIKDE